MYKMTNVNVIEVLHAIMERNTTAYKKDFIVDKEIIEAAAKSDDCLDRRLLWMSRTCGTWCFRERDVLTHGHSAHNTWLYYRESECYGVKAYAVCVNRMADDGVVTGNIYELDYEAYCEHLSRVALPENEAADDSAMEHLLWEEAKTRRETRYKEITPEEYLCRLERKKG